MSIQSLFDESEKDLRINKNNLDQEAAVTGSLYQKYLVKYTKEVMFLKKTQQEYATLKKEKYLHYKLNFNVMLKSNEVPIFLDGDEELQKLDARMECSKSIVTFLEKLLSQISQRSFNIKNAIEWRKFQEGGY